MLLRWMNWTIFKWIHSLIINGESRPVSVFNLIPTKSTKKNRKIRKKKCIYFFNGLKVIIDHICYGFEMKKKTTTTHNEHTENKLTKNNILLTEWTQANALTVTHILFLEMVDYVFVLWICSCISKRIILSLLFLNAHTYWIDNIDK